MTDQTSTAPVALHDDEPFVLAGKGRSYWLTPKVPAANVPNSPCRCGCGQVPNKKGSRYLPGHDGRHKGQLLAQAHAGDEQALTTLVSLGWGKFFVPRNDKRS